MSRPNKLSNITDEQEIALEARFQEGPYLVRNEAFLIAFIFNMKINVVKAFFNRKRRTFVRSYGRLVKQEKICTVFPTKWLAKVGLRVYISNYNAATAKKLIAMKNAGNNNVPPSPVPAAVNTPATVMIRIPTIHISLICCIPHMIIRHIMNQNPHLHDEEAHQQNFAHPSDPEN